MKHKPRNKIRQRRRLADMDMSTPPQRVGFIVLNAPYGIGANGKGKITTQWTDPKEAEAGAIMFLDAICHQKGIEPPAVWELEIQRLPPITH